MQGRDGLQENHGITPLDLDYRHGEIKVHKPRLLFKKNGNKRGKIHSDAMPRARSPPKVALRVKMCNMGRGTVDKEWWQVRMELTHSGPALFACTGAIIALQQGFRHENTAFAAL